MGQVGSNTGSVDNIVQGELVNEGAELQEEGQWLEKKGGLARSALFSSLPRLASKSIPVRYHQRRRRQLESY